MPESLTQRVALTRGFLAKLWRLSAPYWWAEDRSELRVLGFTFTVREKWLARGLLLLIVALAVVSVYISKLFNDWYGRFYDALQNKNEAAYWDELRFFTILALIAITFAVYRLWLRQLLIIRWRRWLTGIYVDGWLSERTYYRMELVPHGTDNPEQRIEQDINRFTQTTLSLTLDLLSTVMTLVTFTVILWGLSGPITLFGITIPAYMFWAALLYAMAGSYITYRFGYPLVGVNFNLERYNADFRYRMVRVRENAESIALYKGEPDEERRLSQAFAHIYEVWWQLMRYTKRLTWLTSFYAQAAIIFPFFVAAPRYFSGAITLGNLMQISSAFGQVQSSLSWFVESYTVLADWKAVVDRLLTFSEAMERTKAEMRAQHDLRIEPSATNAMELRHVDVAVPGGRVLLEGVEVGIAPGEKILLQGPSGSGKTTLFRVLAGLWPFGRGEVRLPKGARVLFLPQKPYIPIGTLREALCYPDRPEAHDEAEMLEALRAAQLGHLADRLDESANWSLVLSGGEQQRLAFARAVLVRPDWLFLDEATSALDEANETALYELISSRLPEATIVSIAHKPSVARFHEHRLRIDPEARRVVRERLVPEPQAG